jgi:hypothetical protein
VYEVALETVVYVTVMEVNELLTADALGVAGVASCVAVAKVKTPALEVVVAVVPFFVLVMMTV